MSTYSQIRNRATIKEIKGGKKTFALIKHQNYYRKKNRQLSQKRRIKKTPRYSICKDTIGKKNGIVKRFFGKAFFQFSDRRPSVKLEPLLRIRRCVKTVHICIIKINLISSPSLLGCIALFGNVFFLDTLFRLCFVLIFNTPGG